MLYTRDIVYATIIYTGLADWGRRSVPSRKIFRLNLSARKATTDEINAKQP